LVGDRLLFDVGADVNTSLFNMRRSSVELDRINMVVLSHEHGAHVGGRRILNMLEDVDAFIPKSVTSQFRGMLASYPNVSLIEVG